jgi:hypothetical protein
MPLAIVEAERVAIGAIAPRDGHGSGRIEAAREQTYRGSHVGSSIIVGPPGKITARRSAGARAGTGTYERLTQFAARFAFRPPKLN